MFLLRENYTTINHTPMFRAGTPLEQCAHTGSSEILAPIGRNLHRIIYSHAKNINSEKEVTEFKENNKKYGIVRGADYYRKGENADEHRN